MAHRNTRAAVHTAEPAENSGSIRQADILRRGILTRRLTSAQLAHAIDTDYSSGIDFGWPVLCITHGRGMYEFIYREQARGYTYAGDLTDRMRGPMTCVLFSWRQLLNHVLNEANNENTRTISVTAGSRRV